MRKKSRCFRAQLARDKWPTFFPRARTHRTKFFLSRAMRRNFKNDQQFARELQQ